LFAPDSFKQFLFILNFQMSAKISVVIYIEAAFFLSRNISQANPLDPKSHLCCNQTGDRQGPPASWRALDGGRYCRSGR